MNLSLKPSTRRFIEQKLKSGRYASAEELLEAGLVALQQQEAVGDFEPGELDTLIAEGEASIKREGVVDASKVFGELRRRSQRQRRGTRKAG